MLIQVISTTLLLLHLSVNGAEIVLASLKIQQQIIGLIL